VIAGHSSGALLAAWIAGNDPDGVAGIVLEDGPFFSTEKGRAEHTFAWLGFEVIHRFLQEEETNYTLYSLEHHYMQTLFNQNGKDNWERIVLNPAKKYMKKHPGTIPKIWYYPKKLGINSIYALTANLQDGTGDYDLRFGETFYDFSWFAGFDQEETLSKITCPALVLHVAPDKATAPGYYDKNGILLSAMDEKDAARVTELIKNSEYAGGFASMHNIHDDLETRLDHFFGIAIGVPEFNLYHFLSMYPVQIGSHCPESLFSFRKTFPVMIAEVELHPSFFYFSFKLNQMVIAFILLCMSRCLCCGQHVQKFLCNKHGIFHLVF
jgi:pimeloyl-ACP methyl ester carboxylesterase